MLVGVCNGLPCRSEVELGTQSAIAVVQGVMKIDAGGLLASATVVIVKSSQIVDHVTVGFTGPERDIITDHCPNVHNEFCGLQACSSMV